MLLHRIQSVIRRSTFTPRCTRSDCDPMFGCKHILLGTRNISTRLPTKYDVYLVKRSLCSKQLNICAAMTRSVHLSSPSNGSASTASTPCTVDRRIDADRISKHCQAKTDPQLDVREVDLPDSSRYRCGHCGESDASWLFWIRRHLCTTCRNLPDFRTICRSEVYRQFGLTYEQVIRGQEKGSLEVMYAPNPRNTGRNAGHDSGSRWMYLYWQTQIEGYAQYLATISSKKR